MMRSNQGRKPMMQTTRQRLNPQVRGFWQDVQATGEVNAQQKRRYQRGLGDGTTSTTSVQTDANAVASIVSTLGKLFGGSSNPWIPAQNQAEANIATIVAAYVAVKNAGQLTANYIATAINQVATINAAFTQFTKQYSQSGAAAGAQTIASNANAVIANMQADLATVPVQPVTSVISSILGIGTPPPQNLTLSTSTGNVTPTITAATTLTAGLGSLSQLPTWAWIALGYVGLRLYQGKKILG